MSLDLPRGQHSTVAAVTAAVFPRRNQDKSREREEAPSVAVRLALLRDDPRRRLVLERGRGRRDRKES